MKKITAERAREIMFHLANGASPPDVTAEEVMLSSQMAVLLMDTMPLLAHTFANICDNLKKIEGDVSIEIPPGL